MRTDNDVPFASAHALLRPQQTGGVGLPLGIDIERSTPAFPSSTPEPSPRPAGGSVSSVSDRVCSRADAASDCHPRQEQT